MRREDPSPPRAVMPCPAATPTAAFDVRVAVNWQAVTGQGLTLTRVPVDLPPRRAPLARVMRLDLLHPARGLVLQPWRTSRPHPDRKYAPVQPGLLAMLWSALPRTLRRPGHVCASCRFSTGSTSKRRAMSVDTFSAAVFAPVRLAGPSAGRFRARPRSPRAVRAPPGAGQPGPAVRLSPIRSRPVKPGSSATPRRQGRGDRHAPVNPHRLAVTRGRDRLRDHREGDVPPARAPIVIRYASPPRGTALSTVSGHGPRAPGPGPPYGKRGARPTAARARRSGIPRAACSRGHPGRPAGSPGSTSAVIAWAKSRSACCWPPSGSPPASHGEPAPGGGESPSRSTRVRLLAGLPVGALLDREKLQQCTGRPEGFAAPPAGRGWGAAGGTGTCDTLSDTADISGQAMRRLRPGLKAGVSTPRF